MEAENMIFKIPRLILHADQYYLIKNQEIDLSCQIEPGWRGATIASVQWIKDNTPIENCIDRVRNELIADGPTLRILNNQYQPEGDYQCSSLIRGIRISNGLHIDTQLVSAPVKFRKARISKFEKVNIETIRVYQPQAIRIPCLGMPDVVPNPPGIHFEKDENVKKLGLSGDRRFLLTSSGMQIAFSMVSDSGDYYCVVTNLFTNKTRKSPYPVRLEVVSARINLTFPVLIYPKIKSSVFEPIILHVVKGKTVILECMMLNVRIMWTKVKPSTSGLVFNNDRLRFQQISGNLVINLLNEADDGVYVCEGYPVNTNNLSEIPKVFYQLIVHAPIDVQLMAIRQYY
ncbi:unnamed protein product [Dracunculus medinensis]|uniref:Ig-like domain-containing protein n=1 Tax=Dracunculus medinensis TaxID=318479 RepID=A0A0N4U9R8_DRAME|nr:unnamed protein product [Dracunculus medinensis]